MPSLVNPIPHIAAATEAAAKIASIQTELFVLNQELKAARKLKQAVLVGVAVLLAQSLVVSTLYWVAVDLHRRGWSPLSLAFLSFLFFGILIAGCARKIKGLGHMSEQPQTPLSKMGSV